MLRPVVLLQDRPHDRKMLPPSWTAITITATAMHCNAMQNERGITALGVAVGFNRGAVVKVRASMRAGCCSNSMFINLCSAAFWETAPHHTSVARCSSARFA